MDGCVYSVLIGFSRERERERHPVRAGAGEGERLGELSTGGEVKEGRTTTTDRF